MVGGLAPQWGGASPLAAGLSPAKPCNTLPSPAMPSRGDGDGDGDGRDQGHLPPPPLLLLFLLLPPLSSSSSSLFFSSLILLFVFVRGPNLFIPGVDYPRKRAAMSSYTRGIENDKKQ